MTWPRVGVLILVAAAAGGVVGYLVALLDGLITRSTQL